MYENIITALVLCFYIVNPTNLLFSQTLAQNELAKKVEEVVEEFDNTENVVLLTEILYTIGHSKVNPDQKRILYFRILRTIENRVDFNFNFNKRPLYKVCPPMWESDEPAVFFCGMSPNGIKDGEVKKQYVAQIEKNKQEWKLYNFQSSLHRLYKKTIQTIKQNETPWIDSEECIIAFYKQAEEYLLYPEKLDYLKDVFIHRIAINRKSKH